MPVINVATFTGMRPAVAKHLLESNESRLASNADMADGQLSPIASPRFEASYPFTVRSIWRHDTRASGKDPVWRVYEDRRSFVESPIAGDSHSRLYMSSDSGLRLVDGDGNEYRLGVDAPSGAPSIGESGQRGGPVSFSASSDTFSFTSSLRHECPYLTPGEKVRFTGTLPPPLQADRDYAVLAGIVAASGALSYQLGDPESETPNEALDITADGTAVCTVAYADSLQDRAYVFTVVNSYGDESAPSLPASVTVDASCNLKLLGLTCSTASDAAPLVKKRIYRTATGTSGDTAYLFVAEIDAALTEYTDSLLDEELAEALPSLDWKPPDTDFRHLAVLPGGILVAHNDGEVAFSGSYMPAVWPSAQRYALQGHIRTLAVSQRTVFALTESVIHALTVDDPTAAFITTLDGYAPCLSENGVVTSPLGVLFPSSDGLYLVAQGMTSAQNVTEGLISDAEWRAFNPASFTAVFYDTTYLAFYCKTDGTLGTLLLDFGKSGQARMRLMDEWGTAVQVIPGGRKIYFSKNIGNTGTSGLYEMFGSPEAPQNATWISKEFLFPTPVNMGAAIVETDLETQDQKTGTILFWGGAVGDQMAGEVPFGDEDSDVYPGGNPVAAVLRIFADGKLRATRMVRPNTFMRLPQGYAARRWEFEISTLRPVRRVAIGTAVEDLR